MKDWKEDLQRIKEQISAKEKKDRQDSELKPLYVSLGLDFGTAYSKVAWKDLATEESGFILFDTGAAIGTPFVESVVYIGKDHRCYAPFDLNGRSDRLEKVEYLKMYLADQPFGSLPTFDGILESDLIEVMSAFYLARLIQVSRKQLSKQRSAMFKKRLPEWYPCLGMPVSQYDSALRQRFEKVLGLAWHLSRSSCKNSTLEDLRSVTNAINGLAVAKDCGAQVYPEIGAAVLSFITSPAAAPGPYVYFDIGGGTMDGVCFRFRQDQGNKSVEYFTGRVEPLGVVALAPLFADTNSASSNEGDNSRSVKDPSVSIPVNRETAKSRVQKLVAHIVVNGKRYDPEDWCISNDRNDLYHRKYPRYLRRNKVERLPVFLGGGGAKSEWHRDCIFRTYKCFGQDKAGVPQYALTELPKPENIVNMQEVERDYERLAVAYGLAAAAATSVKIIALPSKATIEKANNAYIDFDTICRERYGG